MSRNGAMREHILQFLESYTAEHGFAPSVREIAAATGLKSTASVQYHLNRLQEEGRIHHGGGKRTLSLPVRQGAVPLVGVVTAGAPILAVENVLGYVPWEGETGCFALRVRGDSMVNAGILPEDIVIVRPQDTADHGQIVVALLEDEATVKRLYRKDGKVLLIPENPAYEPIESEDIRILGRVKGVVRSYS